MSEIDALLASNAQWAKAVSKSDPTFFEESAKGQYPHTLWIGCADSRVPESVIAAAKPGDIFVHRNIANQFHSDDANVLSVLKYAVDFVGVKHGALFLAIQKELIPTQKVPGWTKIVIVGHSECGGAKACLAAAQSGDISASDEQVVTVPSVPADDPLNQWLAPLTRLAVALGISSVAPAEALPLLVDENVKTQVHKLSESAVIQGAWAAGKDVEIHGLIYELATGQLRDLGISQARK